MTNSRQNIVDVPQEAPAGLQRALSYYEQTLQLREQFPGVIIVPGIEALGDYLRHHTWSQSDVLNAYPWKVKLFRRTAGKCLPFILNTEQVRKAYPERFEFLDKEHKNAVKLFDPKDLKDWFRENLVSSIETVLVPLTMFTDHPNAMRDVYNGIKAERLRTSYESKSRKTLRANRLSLWPEIVSHVRSDLRSQIGQFIDDAKARAAEQGVAANRAHFKEFEVKLPADKLPVFFEKQNIGKTRNYDSEEISYSTYKYFGWAEHMFRPDLDPEMTTRKKAFTQGLWFGGKDCIQDYESGLVELMTAERFVDVFGESALKTADWRFSKDLCTWAEKGALFGPGFPPREQAVLLGINHVAPKER